MSIHRQSTDIEREALLQGALFISKLLQVQSGLNWDS
jgi:hypothetical protein